MQWQFDLCAGALGNGCLDMDVVVDAPAHRDGAVHGLMGERGVGEAATGPGGDAHPPVAGFDRFQSADHVM
ncbi:hypothetical protein B7C42_07827 [Nocardia cerradoensis]|uniref:Uncharacterized protein n=1 Tax=Nocardia cerradoensis TaxID=85688 RepID=A0A231GU28_9NOCA|nr:hypothetical protein B7C42_07827 [Nocardia cerradoensis]